MVKNKLLVFALCLFATLVLAGFASAATVDFSTPTESSGAYKNVTNIVVNISSDDSNSNISINLYNSTKDLVNQSNMTGASFFVNFTSLTDGIYYFNATLTNTTDIINYTATRNVTIDATKPAISYGLGTESDASYISRNGSIVNITVSDANPANVTVNLYNSTGPVNSTFSTSTGVYLNYTSLREGIYYYNATAMDLVGHLESITTRTFTIDRTAPALTSLDEDPSTTSVIISYVANESVNVVIKYGTSSTNLGSTKTESSYASSDDITINSLTSDETYYYNITICDQAGNCITDDGNSFTTDAESSDDSSGGGGDDTVSTFWTATYSVSKDSFISDGFNKVFSKRQRVKLIFSNETHYVGVTDVGTNSVVINVSSTPQTATIYTGETKKFEVNTDGYYDISVKLNSMNGTSANMTVLYLHEKIAETETNSEGNGTNPPTTLTANMNGTTQGTSGTSATSSAISSVKNNWKWILIGLGVLIIALIVIFWKNIWFKLSNIKHEHK